MSRTTLARFMKVYHLLLLILYVYALYYDLVVLRGRLIKIAPITFGGNLKYLTFWDLNFQTFYFGLCCLIDLIEAFSKRRTVPRKLCSFRDWFLAAIAFPFGLVVVIMFWAIYAVDRELVFPARLDDIFPSWLNHVMHTTVLPFLLLEFYFVRHRYPSRKNGIFGTLFVGLSYLFWLLYLGFVMDIWVYGFLKVLSGAYFVLFFVGNALLLLVFYLAGEKLNAVCWGSPGVDLDIEMEKVD
ncbi:androgen-induced gene 1 protein-like isoform X2 [Ptychodera flava]|uniref:androgen-induced gene 1 protein-like isoform X2 n=1 Tax=Ptychodera flava TaxID=63121 RepID=UPI00396AA80D